MVNFSCENIIELLSAYIDGELSDNEKTTVEEHLKSCKSCQEELEIIKELSNKIKFSLEKEDLIPDLSLSVMSRLNESNQLSCNDVDENISAYFDGELEPTQYYSIDDHIKNCTRCEENYKKLKYLRNLIKLSVDSLDIDLWQKVYNRLIQPEQLECSFVSDQLSAYLDREINNELYKSISEHILQCPECRKEFNQIKYIQQEVKKALIKPAENINLWPQVYYKLMRESRNRTFALSSVASFIMILLVWSVLSYLFPVNESSTSIANINSKNNNYTELSSSMAVPDATMVADMPNTSGSYLFSNAFSTPPSDVMPIIYMEEDNNGYDY